MISSATLQSLYGGTAYDLTKGLVCVNFDFPIGGPFHDIFKMDLEVFWHAVVQCRSVVNVFSESGTSTV